MRTGHPIGSARYEARPRTPGAEADQDAVRRSGLGVVPRAVRDEGKATRVGGVARVPARAPADPPACAEGRTTG